MPDLTPLFAAEGGSWALRPIQSVALFEMEKAGGALLPIGVGYGKMLIALLAPRALKAKRPVLLVEASLKDVTREVEIPKYARHFDLPEWHGIVSYNDLSSPKKPLLLEELAPDLIVADEAHALKNTRSVRVKRLRAYLRKHPETKLVLLSGTFTDKSLKDYSHLAKWTLHENSPVPYDYFALEEWCAGLDANPMIPLEPGVLVDLCTAHRHDSHRDAYRCRLVSTVGVVATKETSLGTSLVLYAKRPKTPAIIKAALEQLRDSWSFEDEEIADILGLYRVAHQPALGFYYKWVWPSGVDQEWIEARRDWAQAVRRFLAHRSRPGLDSEMLFISAMGRGEVKLSSHEMEKWEAWSAVKDRPGPSTEAVWLDSFIVDYVGRWMKSERSTGVIWYRHTEVGQAVSEQYDLPQFGPGRGVELAKVSSDGYPFIVVSAESHYKGQNLQGEDGREGYDDNLLLGMLGGKRFEQTLARTHRPGQKADCVNASILQHTAELESGFANALKSAEYIERTTGQVQKLLYANRVGF